LPVWDEGVGSLVFGDGGCDGVVEQAALRDEGRASLLWEFGEQGVEQCPEAAGDSGAITHPDPARQTGFMIVDAVRYMSVHSGKQPDSDGRRGTLP
jgi:hypothetical protein